MNNADKICLITGASSGIGFAIAKALHNDNYKVIATARRLEQLKKLGLESQNLFAGDLNSPNFQDNLVERIIQKFGRCDYLFNCAGTIQVGTIEDINISSVLGTKIRPTAGGYAATKFAIEALSEALRMELTGTDIQVSCIQPGLVMTELHKDWETHPKESMEIHEPLLVDNIVDTVKFIIKQPKHVRIPKLMILPKHHNI